MVPTWNYLAVHVEGSARVVHEQTWIQEHLHRLTDQHEASREQPWSVNDAPAEFTARLMQAIVGIEIRIEKMIGKLKASQNQPEHNRNGVRDGLIRDDSINTVMADFIG